MVTYLFFNSKCVNTWSVPVKVSPLSLGLVKDRLENVGIKLSDERIGCRIQCNYFTGTGPHRMLVCMRHF